ncbi:hypothetical protein Bca4012_032231 [Brassica carinata]
MKETVASFLIEMPHRIVAPVTPSKRIDNSSSRPTSILLDQRSQKVYLLPLAKQIKAGYKLQQSNHKR